MLVRQTGVATRHRAVDPHRVLPGGDLPGGSFAVFLRTLERRYPWLPAPLRVRYAQAYGTRIAHVIGDATTLADMGEELVPQLFAREADYLCREEFARDAEDILWRRTKLGLHLQGHSTDGWRNGSVAGARQCDDVRKIATHVMAARSRC